MKFTNRLLIFPSLALLFFVFSFCNKQNAEIKNTVSNTIAKDSVENNKSNVPGGLRKLVKAYPDFLDSADENYLYWKDGTKMKYDDGREKDFEDMLDNASLKDQMSQEYGMGEDFENPPPVNFEPGRIRCEEFFRKIYGNTSGAAQGNLVNVTWMPKTVGSSIPFTSVNDANIQLEAVSRELDNLPENLKKYVTRLAGTFYWRVIAGTNRLSMHSFGIAIDINTDYSNYWQWDGGKKGKIEYRNKIPMEIVKIFEKYGFIWGGKWYHYDTMHFEYRPELLVSAN
ncbi:MAG TPA: M15 family metallopeptidase [Ignavibacteria bacterium]